MLNVLDINGDQRRRSRDARFARDARTWLVPAILMAASLLSIGCRQDMHDQPRYKPLRPSSFWADERSSRPLVPGTVARGFLREDTLFYAGKVNGKLATEFPFRVTADVVRRGQQRYEIFCRPCHSPVGDGDGMIVRRGYRHPPSFHIDRLRAAPVGHFFDVISNGWGSMPDYAAQIPPADRWAIVAYVRALQYSQNANVNDVPAETRGGLGQAPAFNPNVSGKSGISETEVPVGQQPVPRGEKNSGKSPSGETQVPANAAPPR